MSSPSPSNPAAAAAAATPAAAAAAPVVVAPKPTGVALYWAKYLKSLEKFPIRTKALTAGTLSVVSDLLAQRMRGGEFSVRSVLKQLLIGLAVRGPVVHYWYKILDHLFAGCKETDLSTAVGKVAVDQAVFAPFFNGLYFYVSGLLDGESIATINAKLVAEVCLAFSTMMCLLCEILPCLCRSCASDAVIYLVDS
jgi:hypothetical protein